MKIVFVSNYINHHQIPFCEAMCRQEGVSFLFVQTEPMEEERIRLGWGLDPASLPYVIVAYEDEARAKREMAEADVLLTGGEGPADIVEQRLKAGRPVIRVCERIYREGQWKRFSPRGLVRKYQDHIRYRKAPCYLLCCGAYVASDFSLIGAYPDKMFRWGYFPPLRRYTEEELAALGSADGGELRILWAGRFMPLKHPEFAVDLAERLKASGVPFRLDMVGGGELDEALRASVREKHLDSLVTFCGFLSPDEVRGYMERADIFLFTSNYLEGWGAVVSEAMNSGCAVVAGAQAGAVPYLIRNGSNGVIFRGEDEEDFLRRALALAGAGRENIKRMGKAAYHTIADLWNADTAAARLAAFCRSIAEGTGSRSVIEKTDAFRLPEEGPMSRAEVIKPFYEP